MRSTRIGYHDRLMWLLFNVASFYVPLFHVPLFFDPLLMLNGADADAPFSQADSIDAAMVARCDGLSAVGGVGSHLAILVTTS